LDNVVGVVYAKDLLARTLACQPFDLTPVLVPPLYVPESLSALQLLEQFQKSRIHIALVVDEYGGIQGLATINDVMEAIVGDLSTIDEPVDPEVVRRPDGTWLLGGMLTVGEFKDVLNLRDELPNEDRGDYQTLGGFVMMQLGRVPATGDNFDYGNLRFEVMDMDGHRVDKILVSPLPAASE
jgi:putative hemolysin